MIKNRNMFSRFGMGFVGILLLWFSIYGIISGNLFTYNYWGDVIYAPIVSIGAIILLYIVIFKWKEANKNENIEKPKKKKKRYNDFLKNRVSK